MRRRAGSPLKPLSPLRVAAALALSTGTLAGATAWAQTWNDAGPGRDVLGSAIAEMEGFRQRVPSAPPALPASPLAVGGSPPVAPAEMRPPIPMLDWTQPPPSPAVATPPARRQEAPRSGPAAAPARPRPAAPGPVAAPATPAATSAAAWERRFAEQEREIERLRRMVEEDRRRFEQAGQPAPPAPGRDQGQAR